MRTYMARLGSFSFGIDTAAFQELQRVSTYRWQAQNRIGRKPAQQNTGQGADTINLTGVIYPHWRGGLGQIETLRALAAAGEPLALIYAFETIGQYCGRWCVTEIRDTRTVFFDDGTPRKIDFDIALVEYGDDAATAADQLDSLVDAVGGVDVDGAASQAATVAAQAESVTDQGGALSVIGSITSTVQDVATTIKTGIDGVMNSDAVKLARDVYSQAKYVTSVVQSVQQAASNLPQILDDPLRAPAILGSLSSTAGYAAEAAQSVAATMGLTSGKFNGNSTGSLYSKQVSDIVGTTTTLASAASSIKSTADSLRRWF